MRRNYLLITFLSIILISCTYKTSNINPTEKLRELSNIKNQEFDLDTINSLEIEGLKGTKIHFERDKFEIQDGEKVTLILKEFYDFKELLFNDINTITANNELLESSGVIYISFESNSKKLSLKENEYLKIEFPNSKLKGNKLFSAKLDSLSQFEWTEMTEAKVDTISSLFSRNVGGGIISDDIVIDTTGYSLGEFYKLNDDNNTIFSKTFDWINIDKLVDIDENLSFKIELKNKDFAVLRSYVIYKNRNSFISNYHFKNELEFTKIPVILNQTNLVIIGYKNESFYCSKILLENKEKVSVELKEMDSNELEKLIE